MSEPAITEFLRTLNDRGIRVWSDKGQLRYTAPTGELTTDDVAALRAHKQQITLLLEQAGQLASLEPQFVTRPDRGRSPPSFSQVAYWNEQKLGQRRVIRVVTSILRLRGKLNVKILQACISGMVMRHEALRTRITGCNGSLLQEIDERGNDQLAIYDLSQMKGSVQDVEVQRLITRHVEETVDVSVGPLFSSSLIRRSETESVFIVSMEHIISDGTSRNILVREIFSAYAQLLQRNAINLPSIPLQFPDFSVWQRSTERSWSAMHTPYWMSHLGSCGRLRFPRDKDEQGRHAVPGFGVVNLSIEGRLLKGMREWCRAQRTTVTMGVLAAYASFTLNWCGAREAVFLYQTDGRLSEVIQHAVGYFTFPLYLRIELREDDTFFDLLRRVTEEYCTALEHADYAYLRARMPEAPFLRSTVFNWGIQGPSTDSFEVPLSEGEISVSSMLYEKDVVEDFEMDEEPGIALLDRTSDIWGAVTFPLDGFSFEGMRHFCREFLAFTETLIHQPKGSVKAILAHMPSVQRA